MKIAPRLTFKISLCAKNNVIVMLNAPRVYFVQWPVDYFDLASKFFLCNKPDCIPKIFRIHFLISKINFTDFFACFSINMIFFPLLLDTSKLKYFVPNCATCAGGILIFIFAKPYNKPTQP